jgi:hypothetical protein
MHAVYMNVYVNKYTLIKMWFTYSLKLAVKFDVKKIKIKMKIAIKVFTTYKSYL